MQSYFLVIFLFGFSAGQAPEDLAPLTKFRQQHRKTIDGQLCAAAFVQDRKAYTGCTDAPSPSGVSGRPWCYVEPQVTIFFIWDAFHFCIMCVTSDTSFCQRQISMEFLRYAKDLKGYNSRNIEIALSSTRGRL